MNNELKLMAIKAKSRMLNKGIREIYSTTLENERKTSLDKNSLPSVDILNENNKKKMLLNMIKSSMNNKI